MPAPISITLNEILIKADPVFSYKCYLRQIIRKRSFIYTITKFLITVKMGEYKDMTNIEKPSALFF